MESPQTRMPSKNQGLSAGVFGLRGKTKDLRAAERAGFLVQEFREEETGKGVSARSPSRAELANEISSFLFGYLHEFRIPTHFVENAGGRCMLVRQLAMFPVRVRVWNAAYGAYARRFGLREDQDLPFPVIEHYYRRPGAPETLVNDLHLFALGVLTPEEFRTIGRIASKANAVLRSLFARRELRLRGLALEFGQAEGQIMIGDELTPKTCMTADARPRPGRTRRSLRGTGGEDPWTLMQERLLAREGVLP